jgi:hypothetical protein
LGWPGLLSVAWGLEADEDFGMTVRTTFETSPYHCGLWENNVSAPQVSQLCNGSNISNHSPQQNNLVFQDRDVLHWENSNKMKHEVNLVLPNRNIKK